MARLRKLIAGFVVAVAGVTPLVLSINASSSAAAPHSAHRATTPSVTTTTFHGTMAPGFHPAPLHSKCRVSR